MIKAVTERFKVAIHYTVDRREGGRTQSTKVLVDETLREDRYSNIWTTCNSSLARLSCFPAQCRIHSVYSNTENHIHEECTKAM